MCCFSMVADSGIKARLKYNVGQTEFINWKSIGKTIQQKHFLKVKDVEMVHISQSDLGTFQLIFKDDNSTNNT